MVGVSMSSYLPPVRMIGRRHKEPDFVANPVIEDLKILALQVRDRLRWFVVALLYFRNDADLHAYGVLVALSLGDCTPIVAQEPAGSIEPSPWVGCSFLNVLTIFPSISAAPDGMSPFAVVQKLSALTGPESALPTRLLIPGSPWEADRARATSVCTIACSEYESVGNRAGNVRLSATAVTHVQNKAAVSKPATNSRAGFGDRSVRS